MRTRRAELPIHGTQRYRGGSRSQALRIREGRSRQRRSVSWRRRLSVTAFLVVAVAIVGVALLVQRAVAFNAAVSTEPAYAMRVFGPFSGGDRANVLLLGYSDESREGAYLSDSMNVISIERATGIATMIPIPRDLWVEGMAEVPGNMKINEALRIGYYSDGLAYGAELAARAVSHVTGLEIQGWITLDFQGFQAMVDAIGGITISNPTAFAYTWDEVSWQSGQFVDAFEAGTLELGGERALDYARTRYTSVPEESSDFARLVRQQRVLEAIRSEVTGVQALPKGLAIADGLEGHVLTNLPVLDLAMLAGELSVDRRVELTEGVILQSSTNTLGQYILVVAGQASTTDYVPLHEYLRIALKGGA